MAKPLRHITGVKSSKVEPMDLKDLNQWNAPDGDKFIAKHKIEKHADRVGNGDDVYKGKTKKAAYNRQESGVYEEVEELDELDDATLRTYAKKAVIDKKKRVEHLNKGEYGRDNTEHTRKMLNRKYGIENAVKKITNEETEKLDEISKKKVQSYLDKSVPQGPSRAFIDKPLRPDEKREKSQELARKKLHPHNDKGKSYWKDPAKVHATEEVEIDEAAYSFKAARAGKDIGETGKKFKDIAAKAAERYGSEERGKKVAGAVLAKIRAKHGIKESACNHSAEGVQCEMHGENACPDNDEYKKETKKGKKLLLDKKKQFDVSMNKKTGEVTFGTTVKEAIINEVAPPSKEAEAWIKANKQRFIDEYGKKKGMEVLYAKAWKMHGQSESGTATNTDYAGPGAAGWTTGRMDVGTL